MINVQFRLFFGDWIRRKIMANHISPFAIAAQWNINIWALPISCNLSIVHVSRHVHFYGTFGSHSLSYKMVPSPKQRNSCAKMKKKIRRWPSQWKNRKMTESMSVWNKWIQPRFLTPKILYTRTNIKLNYTQVNENVIIDAIK